MSCEICGHSDCQCKVFVLVEDQPSAAQPKEQMPADVLPLSEHEKALILDFRQNCPNWLSPDRDLNDVNLSNQEKALILGLREQMQITFDEPVEASSINQTFLVDPDVMKMSDLSEQEKAAIQDFWSKCPDKRTASGDPNDPTLGRFEKAIVRALREGPDFIIDARTGIGFANNKKNDS